MNVLFANNSNDQLILSQAHCLEKRLSSRISLIDEVAVFIVKLEAIGPLVKGINSNFPDLLLNFLWHYFVLYLLTTKVAHFRLSSLPIAHDDVLNT